ncbi:MAG: zinc-ribbon domain containing protein [Candidatus Peregrinibacteria bacterium]|nr:zinc-ribbon domain containing protein [Candidatus Peregrinibacteria bacterium]
MAEKNIESTCELCRKRFLIIKQESEFYARQQIPLPRKCMECRRKHRESLRNPRKLFERACDKCQMKLMSSYAPDSPYKVYCEKCYLETI